MLSSWLLPDIVRIPLIIVKCKSRWTLAEKNRRDKVPGAGSAHPEAGLKYNKVGYSNILRHELHNWFFDTHCVFHMHHIHVQQPDWSICSTIQYFWLWKMKNNTNCVFHMYHIHVQKPDKAWAKQCSVSQETQRFDTQALSRHQLQTVNKFFLLM